MKLAGIPAEVSIRDMKLPGIPAEVSMRDMKLPGIPAEVSMLPRDTLPVSTGYFASEHGTGYLARELGWARPSLRARTSACHTGHPVCEQTATGHLVSAALSWMLR